jgi:hypothetical protein
VSDPAVPSSPSDDTPAPPAYAPPTPPAASQQPVYAPPPPEAYNAPTPPPYAPGGYGAPPQAPAYAQPGYPAPPAPYGYGYGGAPAYVKTNTLSILALIGAVLGAIWVLPIIGSLAGAILGHLSLGQIKRTGERGRGMALTGVILGWIGVGIAVLIGLFIVIGILGSISSSGYYS